MGLSPSALLKARLGVKPKEIIVREDGELSGATHKENVNHLIRFDFAKKDETLNEVLNRLELIRKKNSSL